ncbi:MAG TPA: ThiF family adenylyltransferase [Anaeromyxobacteraceae bacterium]|nr:ThiF family adenylyltransferase [Anaeromyxobacteraceae bacterium]
MPLSDAEIARYARQLLLPGFGPVSQEFLRAARVQVVGAGAIAGPAMVYLAQAGVGTITVDDAADVALGDSAHWLYPPDREGMPRMSVAIEALRRVSSFTKPKLHATGADPTAVLVCPESYGVAREAAERARAAGLPHVVAQGDGDGGVVVTVPVGAACFSCASMAGAGLPATPGAAASLGALAALELLLVLAHAAQDPKGRRIELVRGVPQARATQKQPGCACNKPRA